MIKVMNQDGTPYETPPVEITTMDGEEIKRLRELLGLALELITGFPDGDPDKWASTDGFSNHELDTYKKIYKEVNG